MPFCSSCGAENPEGARFCAKCGNELPSQTASSSNQKTTAAQSQNTPAKEVLKTPKMKAPLKAAQEPNPNAPGQTQMFIAAAKVSSAAKMKRVVFFIIGTLIVIAVAFFLVQQILNQHKEFKGEKPKNSETRLEQKTEQ